MPHPTHPGRRPKAPPSQGSSTSEADFEQSLSALHPRASRALSGPGIAARTARHITTSAQGDQGARLGAVDGGSVSRVNARRQMSSSRGVRVALAASSSTRIRVWSKTVNCSSGHMTGSRGTAVGMTRAAWTTAPCRPAHAAVGVFDAVMEDVLLDERREAVVALMDECERCMRASTAPLTSLGVPRKTAMGALSRSRASTGSRGPRPPRQSVLRSISTGKGAAALTTPVNTTSSR
jgi:hypothetical protein